MNAELVAALFSWAMTLSGMHADGPPEVLARPHQFFVDTACSGHECKVYGWYAGQHVVYVDDRLDGADTLAASIIVHEMVHYLQHEQAHPAVADRAAAAPADPVCTRALQMETEAYGVQREFLRQYGVYRPVGASMLQVGCDGTTASALTVAAAGH
jgi:hypothetical protein